MLYLRKKVGQEGRIGVYDSKKCDENGKCTYSSQFTANTAGNKWCMSSPEPHWFFIECVIRNSWWISSTFASTYKWNKQSVWGVASALVLWWLCTCSSYLNFPHLDIPKTHLFVYSGRPLALSWTRWILYVPWNCNGWDLRNVVSNPCFRWVCVRVFSVRIGYVSGFSPRTDLVTSVRIE